MAATLAAPHCGQVIRPVSLTIPFCSSRQNSAASTPAAIYPSAATLDASRSVDILWFMTTRTQASDLKGAAAAFHALSDVTRLKLLDLLRGGERCVCELMEAVGAAQSRLSFHLGVLKDAGLVLDRREGRWVYYRLNQEQVERLAGVLTDCCGPAKSWLKGSCC